MPADGQVRHRGENTIVPRCVIVHTRAPQFIHSASLTRRPQDRFRVAASARHCDRGTAWQTRQHPNVRFRQLDDREQIAAALRRVNRAAAITSCLVLPASVMIVWAPTWVAIVLIKSGYCPTGVAAIGSASASSARQSSSRLRAMTDSACAASRLPRCDRRRRSCGAFCAARRASANDPPMSPTPMTTSLPICGALRSLDPGVLPAKGSLRCLSRASADSSALRSGDFPERPIVTRKCSGNPVRHRTYDDTLPSNRR